MRNLIAMTTHEGNESLVRASIDTWAKDLPDNFRFITVFGGGEDEPVLDGDRLIVPCEEHYRTLPLKTWWLMKWFSEQSDFDYLMKCDDDLYIRDVVGLFDNLLDFNGLFMLSSVGTGGTYHYQHVEVEYQNEYQGSHPKEYCFGCCYIVSKMAAGLVASTSMSQLEDCTLDVGYEDMMVAKVLSSRNIEKNHFPPCRIFHFLDENGIRHFHKSSDYFSLRDYYHYQGDKALGTDKKKAFENWLEGAGLGNLQCMGNLAWAYYEGIGVDKDLDKHTYWSKKFAQVKEGLVIDERFGMASGYYCRNKVRHESEHDESAYHFAFNLADERGYKKIVDLTENGRIPERFIVSSDNPDLVICANMIERSQRPDELLKAVRLCYPKSCLIVATPNRSNLSLFNMTSAYGPPFSDTRYREWDDSEFDTLVSSILGSGENVVQLRGQLLNMVKVCDNHPGNERE